MIVRLPESWRQNARSAASRSRCNRSTASRSRWASWPTSALEESPPGIEHEAGRRRTFIQVNVRNRDVASFVQEAQRRVAAESRTAARLLAPMGRRLREPAIGQPAAVADHADRAAADLVAAVHDLQVDATGRC